MRPIAFLLMLLLAGCVGSAPNDTDVNNDGTTEDPLDACVEQIVEPTQGYIIARILRRYDVANRPVDEQLVDLDPRHYLQAPCFALPTGYSRYTRTWSYDANGRKVSEELADLGDGGGCGGERLPSESEWSWEFNVAGELSAESRRYLVEGELVETNGTVYEYDAQGLLTTAVYSTSGASPSTNTWTRTFNADGQPVQLDFVYENNVGDRFLSRTSWDYDASGLLLSETDEQDRPLDGGEGFFRVELRLYDAAGNTVEEWIDHHKYQPGSNFGPYGADGVYDSHYERIYDAAGGLVGERLIHDFQGGIVDYEVAWTRDGEGRVTRESRSNPGYSPYGAYYAVDFVYVPFGLASERAYDGSGSLAYEVRYDYDAYGRHLATRMTTDDVTFATLAANAYEYDADGRLSRWLGDFGGDGTWDDERRYSYGCGIDFTHDLGLGTSLR